MKEITYLNIYNLILIRYSGEIWLKSRKVKMRMLRTLMKNIKNMLNLSGISFYKYQLTNDSARILFFFSNKNIPKVIKVLKNIFGIYSFSPALRTSNKLKNIIERTIEIGNKIFQKEDIFALRVKRSGIHDYTSQEVAIKVGQAIMDKFSYLNLKVNLSNPIKKIYIEIRNEFAYIYTDIIMSKWGGLPIEKNKKILCMDIGRLNDLLAGFLLMRRGCEIYPILFDLIDDKNLFKLRLSNWKKIVKYYPNLKFIVRKINLVKILEKIEKEIFEKKYICAVCRLVRFELLSKMLKRSDLENFDRIKAISDGVSLNNTTLCSDEIDLESIALTYLFFEYPIFTPIIGLKTQMINRFIFKISNRLQSIEYCKFKPKNQEISVKKLKSLYNSLKLNDLIRQSLNDVNEFKIR